MTEPTDASPRRPWIVWAIAGVVVLIVAALVAWWLLRPGDVIAAPDASSSQSPTAEPTPAVTLTPGPTPTAKPTPLPTDGPIPPELPPVAPDEPVDNADVVVSLALVESVYGEAQVSGEISGPAIRVTVRFVNNTDEALPLGYAAVNAYYGTDRTPAGTVMNPGGAPFAGTLAPGDSATGVYIFSIPESERGAVTITVDYLAGEPTAVFQGDFR